MTLWIAFRKPAAGVLHQARVDTFLAHTGLAVPTIVVALTANRLARNLRIANGAWRTDTHRMVVLDKALGALATVTWIDTLAVDTCLPIGAVIITGAAWRIWQLDGPTACVLNIGDPALAAGADHGAEGQAVDNAAPGRHVAGRQAKAGVLTALIEAGCVVGTVAIHTTLWIRIRGDGLLFGCTGHQGVTDPARRAGALGVVIEHGAGGTGCAGVLIEAGVETTLANAGRVLGTVGVDATLYAEALLVRVALQAGRTAAGLLMVGGVALRIAGAGVVGNTGVQAVGVDAHLGDSALGVAATSH